MKPWLFAMLGAVRVQVTPPPFTANATWVAPVTTSRIDTLLGKGQDGTPEIDTRETSYYYDTYSYFVYNNGDGTYTFTDPEFVSTTATSGPGQAPDDFCHPESGGRSVCFLYGEGSTTTGSYIPATNGASTTGFGKIFPGGTGGAAAPVTYPNVAVTPGASYSLVVPAGGSITITYWQ